MPSMMVLRKSSGLVSGGMVKSELVLSPPALLSASEDVAAGISASFTSSSLMPLLCAARTGMDCTLFTYAFEGLFMGVVLGIGTLCFLRKSTMTSSPSERDMPPHSAAAASTVHVSPRGIGPSLYPRICVSSWVRAGLDMTLCIPSSSLIRRRPFRGGGAVMLLLRDVSVERNMPSLDRCICFTASAAGFVLAWCAEKGTDDSEAKDE